MAVVGAMAAVSFLFAPRYRVSGVVEMRVAGDSIAMAHADWRLSEYVLQSKGRATSRQSLATIIMDPRLRLYESERAVMPLEDVEDQMRRDLTISVAPPVLARTHSAVVSIEFTYTDPVKAVAALNETISHIVEVPVSWTEEHPDISGAGADARIAALQARVDSLEKRLGILPSPTQSAGITGRAHFETLVVDPPSVPEKPVSPRRETFAGIGTAAGLALGVIVGLVGAACPPICRLRSHETRSIPRFDSNGGGIWAVICHAGAIYIEDGYDLRRRYRQP